MDRKLSHSFMHDAWRPAVCGSHEIYRMIRRSASIRPQHLPLRAAVGCGRQRRVGWWMTDFTITNIDDDRRPFSDVSVQAPSSTTLEGMLDVLEGPMEALFRDSPRADRDPADRPLCLPYRTLPYPTVPYRTLPYPYRTYFLFPEVQPSCAVVEPRGQHRALLAVVQYLRMHATVPHAWMVLDDEMRPVQRLLQSATSPVSRM